MILSVSRRTDIPADYADWFFNRLKDGFAYVRNPMNPNQVSRIPLSKDVVDCIVFWTKNPEKMLPRLDELDGYMYYFQFTLTGYGKDIEPGIDNKKTQVIPVFQKLAQRIGKERVIWRYDPIFFNSRYTPEYHLRAFEQIAAALEGYTQKCVISFLDMYAKIRKNVRLLGLTAPDTCGQARFAARLLDIARTRHMELATCAEALDLKNLGISHNRCIDPELIERLLGCALKARKDKNQRGACGCAESIDIGVYNTCRNGCKYCYANHSPESVLKNFRQYDPESPLLCGSLTERDKITERKAVSLKAGPV